MNPKAAVINECSKPPEVEVTLEELARAMQRADAEQQRLSKIALDAMRASDGAELVMSRVSEKYAELCNGVLLLDGKAICPRRHFSSNHNRMADVVSGDTKVKIPKSIAEESGILSARTATVDTKPKRDGWFVKTLKDGWCYLHSSGQSIVVGDRVTFATKNGDHGVGDVFQIHDSRIDVKSGGVVYCCEPESVRLLKEPSGVFTSPMQSGHPPKPVETTTRFTKDEKVSIPGIVRGYSQAGKVIVDFGDEGMRHVPEERLRAEPN